MENDQKVEKLELPVEKAFAMVSKIIEHALPKEVKFEVAVLPSVDEPEAALAESEEMDAAMEAVATAFLKLGVTEKQMTLVFGIANAQERTSRKTARAGKRAKVKGGVAAVVAAVAPVVSVVVAPVVAATKTTTTVTSSTPLAAGESVADRTAKMLAEAKAKLAALN